MDQAAASRIACEQRRTALHAALAADIARWAVADGEPYVGPVPGLQLFHRTSPSLPASCMYEPSVTLLVMGRKRVMLGEVVYVYDAGELLIASVDLAAIGQIVDASPVQPFLAMTLKLDQRGMTELIAEGKLPPPRSEPTGRGMTVGTADVAMLGAFQRLLDLFEQPDSVPVLAPLIKREILCRLMMSEDGRRLWQIGAQGSQGQRIAHAIAWIRANIAQALRVDELAASVQMSVSTFHHHFRAITAMSPLQFQKQLRLHEARRLLLTERLDAASAGFKVGYESPSQFNREYHRMFGAPPLRDVAHLREQAAPRAAQRTAAPPSSFSSTSTSPDSA